jgi:hypothetical protein
MSLASEAIRCGTAFRRAPDEKRQLSSRSQLLQETTMRERFGRDADVSFSAEHEAIGEAFAPIPVIP